MKMMINDGVMVVMGDGILKMKKKIRLQVEIDKTMITMVRVVCIIKRIEVTMIIEKVSNILTLGTLSLSLMDT